MWTQFPPPELAQWRQKLEREAAKTLGSADRLANALDPDYQPLYTQAPPSARQQPGSACRLAARVHSLAAFQDAHQHGCSDFFVDDPTLFGTPPPQVRLYVGADIQQLPHGAAQVWDVLSGPAPSRPGTIVVSTLSVRERGGSVATELWVGLCGLVEVLRQGARGCAWQTGLSPLLLREIAKCRAIRRLVDKLGAALGSELPFELHAAQTQRHLSGIDPSTNLLRSSSATFIALTGGCQTVLLQEFDQHPRASHWARNQYHVMFLEGLLQRVDDPFAGTYSIEEWTEQLARAAWNEMRRSEGQGGLDRAEALQRIADEAAQEAAQLDLDRHGLVGVTRYVAADAPLAQLPKPPFGRRSTPYEELRSRLRGQTALLVGGSGTPRETFARKFLAIAAVASRSAACDEEIAQAPERIVVLCCGDDEQEGWLARLQLSPRQVLVVAGNRSEGLTLGRSSARAKTLEQLAEAL